MTHQRLIAIVCAVLAALVQVPADAQWRWTPQTGRWINVDNLPKETPELQIEQARSLMIRGQYKEAMQETEQFKDFYDDTAFADENQFLRGEILINQRKYSSAAQEYQELIANYPASDLYDEVIEKQYDIGDAYYDQGLIRMDKRWRLFRKRPLKRAAEVYGMVIDNKPFTPEAAEAQYKIGLSHYAREEYVEAAFEYRRVLEDYVGSDWIDEASHGLALCYFEGSYAPDYDQSPSLLAMDAIEDFKQRYPLDERVAGLETMSAEMLERVASQRLLTAQYHVRRREFDSARIYHEVVVNQFPETEAAEEARAWLDANPVQERQADTHTIRALRDRLSTTTSSD